MKFLKIASFGVLFLALLLTACNKEVEQIVPSQSNNLTKENVVLNDVSSATPDEVGDIVGRYMHNGVEIDPSTIDFNDDNLEMYYDYTSDDPSVILVFYTEEEVLAWIATLDAKDQISIQKSRDFTKYARQIATETNAVSTFETTGQVPVAYTESIALLNQRIYEENYSRAIGFVFSNPNFTGNSLPILGGFVGFTTMLLLGSPPNSTQSLGLAMTHNYHSKIFYFGSRLFVWGANSRALQGGTWFNVGGAAGPFHCQLAGALSLWGSFNPNGAIAKSYKPAPGIF